MERTLNLASVRSALGAVDEGSLLPTAEALRALLVEAEGKLFINQPALNEEAVLAAWYLHAVASHPRSADLYGPERVRSAFQVSSHIFDLALSAGSSDADSLRLGFAAQVGYLNGEQDPNALAIHRRLLPTLQRADSAASSLRTIVLRAGIGLLGLDHAYLRKHMPAWQGQLAKLALTHDTHRNGLAASAHALNGIGRLLRHLQSGDDEFLRGAIADFRSAVYAIDRHEDLDSRWVAAHLGRLAQLLSDGSPWRLLPPDMQGAAYRAFTMVAPVVLALWPPQRTILRNGLIDPEKKRVILSVPTSAGKTLLAQLLTVAHLSQQGTGVCYVTPLRSLAREVRQGLARRLHLIERRVSPELADFEEIGTENNAPDVEVMTPERLFHAIRTDPSSVLERFGLFIFDEAHTLSIDSRGLNLEFLISYLHWKTRPSDHRIILMSAALGQRGHIQTWLLQGEQEHGLDYHSAWRGPRRLNAIFSTAIDWQTPTTQARRSRDWPSSTSYPLKGIVHLRPAGADTAKTFQLINPVGTIEFKNTPDGARGPIRERTPMRELIAPLVRALGDAGSVLIVCGTRAEAKRAAQAIAARIVETTGKTKYLADLVASRLGEEHPQVDLLRRGVAYHHAGLPQDVLDELERSARDGTIHYIVSTTTLTDGINLPVRSVVVSVPEYEGQPEQLRLTGARLLNALGRAGRAAKETEGWVILAKASKVRHEDHVALANLAETIQTNSVLAQDAALAELATLEADLMAQADALFEATGEHATSFASFVWFLMAAGGEDPPTEADLSDALSSTLAFTQLAEEPRARLGRIAASIRRTYLATPTGQRTSYARAGTSLGSARVLEALARQLGDIALGLDDSVDDAMAALRVLDEAGILDRLRALPECSTKLALRVAPSSGSDPIPVTLMDLLRPWLAGNPIPEMADGLLALCETREWALEQLVDTASGLLEHFLPWSLGHILSTVNERLADAERELFCPLLPLYIRYGVSAPAAVQLLRRGVRSRVVAQRIALRMGVTRDADEIGSELGLLSTSEWRAQYGAAPSDIVDLLQFTRRRDIGLVRAFIQEGTCTLDLRDALGAADAEHVDIRAARRDKPPARLEVRSMGTDALVGRIPSNVHAEVEELLATGMPFEAAVRAGILQFVRSN